MHFVYIIYSPSKDKYYVGESTDPVERVQQHNTKHYKGSSTSFTDDWELLQIFATTARKEALVVEKHIKKMKSKKYTSKLCRDSEFGKYFIEKMLEKYRIDIQENNE